MRLVSCELGLKINNCPAGLLSYYFRAFNFGRMGQCDQVILVNLSGHGRKSGVRLVFGLCYPMFKVKVGGGEGVIRREGGPGSSKSRAPS